MEVTEKLPGKFGELPGKSGDFPEARGSLTPSQRLAKFVSKERPLQEYAPLGVRPTTAVNSSSLLPTVVLQLSEAAILPSAVTAKNMYVSI